MSHRARRAGALGVAAAISIVVASEACGSSSPPPDLASTRDGGSGTASDAGGTGSRSSQSRTPTDGGGAASNDASGASDSSGPSSAGASSGGAGAEAGGGEGTGDAGAGGGAGGADASADGGSPAVSDASASADVTATDDAPPPAFVLCPSSYTWSNTSEVGSVDPATFARFGSVSANELTVAWTSPSGSALVADRASTSDPFGTPAEIDVGDAGIGAGRVALSPSGTEIIVSVPSRHGNILASFLRPSVGQPWSPGSAEELATINAATSEPGGAITEPVIRGDGLSLFYVLTVGSNSPVLYESPWDSSAKAWAAGVPLANADFVSSSAAVVRRPTGASADGLTLFFFDGVVGHERAAWRNSPSSASFDTFVDLPQVPEAAPSGSCLTLYFQGTDPDAGTAALFTGQ